MMVERHIRSISVILIMICVTHQTTNFTSDIDTTSTATSENSKSTGVCHIYGDPHVIVFPQQTEAFQNQYWCKMSGVHSVLQNDYVQIVANIHNGTWLIDEFIVRLFKDNQLLCTITNDEQYCASSEIRITRPSLTQIEILYTTPQIYISIIPHYYQQQWYDISVRMSHIIIHQSTGLCITPPSDSCETENSLTQGTNVNALSRSICELYLMASDQAMIALSLIDDLERRNNALIACIHDYETTGNQNFGASAVNMIIKHGINQQQSDDFDFQLQTISSIDVIQNVTNTVSNQINLLFGTTTPRPVTNPTITTLPIRETTFSTTFIATTPRTTTISDCSRTVKSTHTILILLSLLIFIKIFYLYI